MLVLLSDRFSIKVLVFSAITMPKLLSNRFSIKVLVFSAKVLASRAK